VAEPTGRLIPSLPRWTTHEKEGRKNDKSKGSLHNYMGAAKGWCYICHSEHLFAEPHTGTGPKPVETETRICEYCGHRFKPTNSKPGRFCDPVCSSNKRRADARLRKASQA